MKRNKAIIWGIIIFVAAAGLLVFAINPWQDQVTVPVWKWFAAALLIYWLLWKIIFGRNLTTKLTVFLPLALLFMVFEKEIGGLVGSKPDLINNWILLAAALMLDCGVYFIFRGKNKNHCWNGFSVNNGGKTRICSGSGNSSGSGDGGTRSSGSSGNDSGKDWQSYWFRMGDNVCYLDASRRVANVSNRLGSLNVYYQNTDVGDLSQPLELNLENKLGATTVHVPRNWRVDLDAGRSSMGEVNCRNDADITIRTLSIHVNNHLGEVDIVSEY